jgi:hypothetical protein
MILSSRSICLRGFLAIDSFTHTNSERVPHVRTSVRGLIKTGDPDFLQEALTRATCAAFIKESRMKSREAKKLDRKSGGSPSKVCLFLYPERVLLLRVQWRFSVQAEGCRRASPIVFGPRTLVRTWGTLLFVVGSAS